MNPLDEPEFHDRQVWDPAIRAYRRVSLNPVEVARLARVRDENRDRVAKAMTRANPQPVSASE